MFKNNNNKAWGSLNNIKASIQTDWVEYLAAVLSQASAQTVFVGSTIIAS